MGNPQDQWLDLYPTIVSKAGLFDVLSTGGDDGSRDRALQLMYTETHALSPLVPTRGVNFLRYCCKVNEGVWVVVDSSVDGLRDFARKGDVSAFTLVYLLEGMGAQIPMGFCYDQGRNCKETRHCDISNLRVWCCRHFPDAVLCFSFLC